MIPIIYNHDYSQLPIGKAELYDGRVIFKLNPDARIKTEQLLKVAPEYIIHKETTGGVVLECELIGLSISPIPIQPAEPSKNPGTKTI